MNNKEWNKKIKNNFDNAANNYLNYSNIQLFFAKKIVSYIKELNMQSARGDSRGYSEKLPEPKGSYGLL